MTERLNHRTLAMNLDSEIRRLGEMQHIISSAAQGLRKIHDQLQKEGMVEGKIAQLAMELGIEAERIHELRDEVAEPGAIVAGEQPVESRASVQTRQGEPTGSPDPVSERPYQAPTMRQAMAATRARQELLSGPVEPDHNAGDGFRKPECSHSRVTKQGGCFTCMDCGETMGE